MKKHIENKNKDIQPIIKSGDIVRISDHTWNVAISNVSITKEDEQCLSRMNEKFGLFRIGIMYENLSSFTGTFLVIAVNVRPLPTKEKYIKYDTILQDRDTKEILFVNQDNLKVVDICKDCGQVLPEKTE